MNGHRGRPKSISRSVALGQPRFPEKPLCHHHASSPPCLKDGIQGSLCPTLGPWALNAEPRCTPTHLSKPSLSIRVGRRPFLTLPLSPNTRPRFRCSLWGTLCSCISLCFVPSLPLAKPTPHPLTPSQTPPFPGQHLNHTWALLPTSPAHCAAGFWHRQSRGSPGVWEKESPM